MNRQDATELATTISQLWPRGLQTSVWEEVLRTDYGDPVRAAKAIQKLKRIIAHSPNIAHFHEQYMTIPATHVGATAVCTDCNNDGWTIAPEYERQGITYTASQPCGHCRHGERAAESTIWKERQMHQPTTEETAA